MKTELGFAGLVVAGGFVDVADVHADRDLGAELFSTAFDVGEEVDPALCWSRTRTLWHVAGYGHCRTVHRKRSDPSVRGAFELLFADGQEARPSVDGLGFRGGEEADGLARVVADEVFGVLIVAHGRRSVDSA